MSFVTLLLLHFVFQAVVPGELFIRFGHGLCKQGCRWIIGDGSSILFWEDIWLEDIGPLISQVDFEVPEQLRYRPVVDFVDDTGQWNLGLFLQFFPRSILKRIRATPTPVQGNGKDELYWQLTASGKFTVQSAYQLLGEPEEENEDRLWQCLWSWKGPERVRTFLWLVAHNKLPTKQHCFRRNSVSNDGCPRCHLDTESTLHARSDCPWARNLWHRLLPGGEHRHFLTSSLHGWLLHNNRLYSSSPAEMIQWPLVLLCGCYGAII